MELSRLVLPAVLHHPYTKFPEFSLRGKGFISIPQLERLVHDEKGTLIP